MARAVWTGVIRFGLVSVPVGMFTATDQELAHVAPGRSRALEVSSFADLDEIDPIYFNKTYYLAPSSDDALQTYALLRDAMAQRNRAAIASVVMHGKQHLAAIRAWGRVLVLETLFFADEVRDPEAILDRLPGTTQFHKGELAMAAQLIASMEEPWQPDRYRDIYTDKINELIAAKRRGNEVQQVEEAPEPTQVVDLFDALRRSVESASRRGTRPAAKRAATKKVAAKRTPAKRMPRKRPTTTHAAAKRPPAKRATVKKPVRKAS